MNTIDVLIEGYVTVTETGPASPSLGGWIASGTTTLITTESGLKIIADPGANKKLLLQRLGTKGLGVEDIDYVFLTHLHLDHALLMGIFPKAKVINHEAITDGDKGELVSALIPDTDISVIKTPGHEYAGASLLVPTDNGTVGIVGDVFWFFHSAEASRDKEVHEQKLEINAPDDFATDMETLKKSRQEVLSLCDWIIPGHGKMMQVVK